MANIEAGQPLWAALDEHWNFTIYYAKYHTEMQISKFAKLLTYGKYKKVFRNIFEFVCLFHHHEVGITIFTF